MTPPSSPAQRRPAARRRGRHRPGRRGPPDRGGPRGGSRPAGRRRRARRVDRSRVDYGEATILPGLVDAHTHLVAPGDGTLGDDVAKEDDDILLLQAAKNARTLLHSGVTTLRENGAKGRVAFSLREGIRRRLAPGPGWSSAAARSPSPAATWATSAPRPTARSPCEPRCGSCSRRAPTTSRSWPPAARPGRRIRTARRTPCRNSRR